MPWGDCANTVDAQNIPYVVASLRCLPVLFYNILTALFMFGGTIAAFMIIFSGFRFILSSGDAKRIEGARNTFVYAILGLLLILFSVLILNIIATVTGVKCILDFGPFKEIASKTCAQ